MTEDEMAGWHHQLDGHGFGQTPGDGQGGLACRNPRGHKARTRLSDRTATGILERDQGENGGESVLKRIPPKILPKQTKATSS